MTGQCCNGRDRRHILTGSARDQHFDVNREQDGRITTQYSFIAVLFRTKTYYLIQAFQEWSRLGMQYKNGIQKIANEKLN